MGALRGEMLRHSGRDAGRKAHRVRHAGGGALSRADGQGRRARRAGAAGRQKDLPHHDRRHRLRRRRVAVRRDPPRAG